MYEEPCVQSEYLCVRARVSVCCTLFVVMKGLPGSLCSSFSVEFETLYGVGFSVLSVFEYKKKEYSVSVLHSNKAKIRMK